MDVDIGDLVAYNDVFWRIDAFMGHDWAHLVPAPPPPALPLPGGGHHHHDRHHQPSQVEAERREPMIACRKDLLLVSRKRFRVPDDADAVLPVPPPPPKKQRIVIVIEDTSDNEKKTKEEEHTDGMDPARLQQRPRRRPRRHQSVAPTSGHLSFSPSWIGMRAALPRMTFAEMGKHVWSFTMTQDGRALAATANVSRAARHWCVTRTIEHEPFRATGQYRSFLVPNTQYGLEEHGYSRGLYAAQRAAFRFANGRRWEDEEERALYFFLLAFHDENAIARIASVELGPLMQFVQAARRAAADDRDASEDEPSSEIERELGGAAYWSSDEEPEAEEAEAEKKEAREEKEEEDDIEDVSEVY